MQRTLISGRALRSAITYTRLLRRGLASVAPETVRDTTAPVPPPPTARRPLLHSNTLSNELASFRRSYPPLNNASYIRFNPSSDSSFVGIVMKEFKSSLEPVKSGISVSSNELRDCGGR